MTMKQIFLLRSEFIERIPASKRYIIVRQFHDSYLSFGFTSTGALEHPRS